MIEIYLPSTRKSSYFKEPIKPITETPVVHSMFGESSRRNAIVKTLAQKCPYKAKDYVLPNNEKARAEYGRVLVEKICSSYAQLGKTEPWPSNNLPLIVHGYSEKKDYHFICTTNFLVPYNQDGSEPKAE